LADDYTRTGDARLAVTLPVNEAVCAITRVNGAFRGDGEIAQIENVNGMWVLWGTSQQANTSIGAQCVYLNQQ
jgi:hypothetical protein